MSYASTAINFVARTNPAASKSLPAFRPRKKHLRSTHCELPILQGRHVASTQTGVIGREAFKEMFVASRPKFVAVAQRIVRNREDAQDAVQNAFISGFRHLHGFDGRCALTTWFTRIVMNSALMILRKRRLGKTAIARRSNGSRIFRLRNLIQNHITPHGRFSKLAKEFWKK